MKAEDYGAQGLALFILGLFALVFLFIAEMVRRLIVFLFSASDVMSVFVSVCVATMIVGILIAVVAMFFEVKNDEEKP